MQCVNKNTREYQTLLKQSGLPDFILSAEVGRFLEKLDRYPDLNELLIAVGEEVDSTPAIKKDLKLNKDNVTSSQNITSSVNAENIDKAIPKLNDKYRDKQIEVLTLGDKAKVYITPRPTSKVDISTIDSDINSLLYLNQIIDKLQDLYGINIIHISNAELNNPEWKDIVGVHSTKAFVYNGNIYVNTDIATIDSPIHEMLHILFGSMKFTNRNLYEQLISSAENFNKDTIEMYPNRTREDINEEAFITELSKYLTGQRSALDVLDQKSQYEIFYNVNRTLDSILMGGASVNCIPKSQLYQMNLKTLAKLVGSTSMTSDFHGTMDNATLNRILANKKSELMEKGELREECE